MRASDDDSELHAEDRRRSFSERLFRLRASIDDAVDTIGRVLFTKTMPTPNFFLQVVSTKPSRVLS